MTNFSSYEDLDDILTSVKAYIDAKPAGKVNSVNNIDPDENGNVEIETYTIEIAGGGEGTVKSVSVNGGDKNEPDEEGNVDLDIETYTVEVAGGSITASIDGGEAVEPDESNNINLNVPREYAKIIRTTAGDFVVEDNYEWEDEQGVKHEVINDNIIDLGYTGKPQYNARVRYAKAKSGKTFYAFRVQRYTDINCKISDMNGNYVWFNSTKVLEVKGNVWVFRAKYGSLGEFVFISGMLYPFVEIQANQDWYAVEIITEFNSPDDFKKEYIYPTDWKRDDIKGYLFNMSDFNTEEFKDVGIYWYYKPIMQRDSEYDKNTIYPNLIMDAKSLFTETQDREGPMAWIGSNEMSAAQYVFKDCWENEMEYETLSGEIVTGDYCFWMPPYPDKDRCEGWKLIDFCCTWNQLRKTADKGKKYHCVLKDDYGNVLFDVSIPNSPSYKGSFNINDCFHIYKRLYWDGNVYLKREDF